MDWKTGACRPKSCKEQWGHGCKRCDKQNCVCLECKHGHHVSAGWRAAGGGGSMRCARLVSCLPPASLTLAPPAPPRLPVQCRRGVRPPRGYRRQRREHHHDDNKSQYGKGPSRYNNEAWNRQNKERQERERQERERQASLERQRLESQRTQPSKWSQNGSLPQYSNGKWSAGGTKPAQTQQQVWSAGGAKNNQQQLSSGGAKNQKEAKNNQWPKNQNQKQGDMPRRNRW